MIDEDLSQDHAEELLELAPAEENLDKYTPEEQEAMSKGWTPDKAAYETANPHKKWKTAESFLDAEEMIGSILDLKKELREQAKVAKELVAHNHRLAEKQRAKELAELEAMQLEAVEVADPEAFKKAKDAYNAKVKEPILEVPTVSEQRTPEELAQLKEFVDRNGSWCNDKTPENKRMMLAADEIYILLQQELSGKSHKEYLKLTEEKVKALFSHRFVNNNRSAPAVTAGGGVGKAKKSNGWTYGELSPVQKSVCDALVASGKTKDFYLDQLAALYGPKNK